jgi:outer membrane protein assembly factor BamD
MMSCRVRTRLSLLLAGGLLFSLVGATIWGCAPKQGKVAIGSGQADKFLFDNGTQALTDKKWLRAREYFRQVVDNYPQSPYRPDAKLGLGDSYLGEDTAESLVLAINEFREFLTFYPTNHRADYAQYKLGLAHFQQMAAPDRDQTETKGTVKEFETFLERYPNSSLADEAASRLREARDRLSEADYRVGLFYFRSRWYPGAIARFTTLLKNDPQFTTRDAVYYYLGESYLRLNRKVEALPYFDRLVQQFPRSEFLDRSQKRISELKTEEPVTQKAVRPPGRR